jgi:hypothetical protein
MKKIFLAIATVAALASCTKSEVEYTPAKEITFTPVSKNITKAMMDNGEVFNTDEKFNVWAFYNPTAETSSDIATWVGQYTTSSDKGAKVYLDEKTFAYDKDYSLWAGDEAPYFWPKVGSLAFAGYHPSSATATYDLSSAANKMTFTGIKNSWVSNEETNTEDLMYFNLTPAYTGNNVIAVFKHALSWLTINVATTSETLTAGATIVVSSVKFTGVKPEGTGTVNNQEPISWETSGTAGPVETMLLKEDNTLEKITLSTIAHKLREPLFIPQPMDGNLEITYTIESPEDKDGVISSFTETKVIKLNTLKDEDKKALTEWEAAKHYIYNIVIGTEEILIDASVVNWTEVTIPVEVNKTPANDSNIEGSGSDSDDSESGNN